MNVFVNSLTENDQLFILKHLIGNGIEEQALEDAMNSRLCDLEETIDISRIKEALTGNVQVSSV